MRKLLCLLCCVAVIVSMCSCAKAGNNSAEVMNSSSGEISSEVASQEILSSSETEESQSAGEASSEEKPQSQPASSEESKAEQPTESNPEPENKNDGIEPFTYTVNDPDNLRGLSTEKRGFSFGVAEGGKPHAQSVINQQTFDAFENVKALALDNKTENKVMYLTFDNGYEFENLTADILDTLKEKKVKAAFFITLSYAKRNKALVQRMIDEGHIVGNHSASHLSFPKLTRSQMAEEIAKLDNYLRENLSYTSPYFRFPSGEYSENALELVTSIGFKSVFWSVAYADWDTSSQKGEEYAFTTVTSRFHPGAVILLHAVSRDNAKTLGRMIDYAVSEGYTFSTLDNYFN